MTIRNRKLTEPLETITMVLGALFAVTLVFAGVATLVGSGSVGGLGHTSVCVTDTNVSGGGESNPFAGAYTARPGAAIQPPNSPLTACALHPGFGERLLYSLTTIPGLVLWGGILLLLWRLILLASRRGPFTLRVAAAMRRLGWFIIAGAALAAAVEELGTVMLLRSMVAPAPESLGSVVVAAGLALLPVPALAGAALLTFARMVRLGAAMDDEIKSTV